MGVMVIAYLLFTYFAPNVCPSLLQEPHFTFHRKILTLELETHQRPTLFHDPTTLQGL